jgi:hypothetical protein
MEKTRWTFKIADDDPEYGLLLPKFVAKHYRDFENTTLKHHLVDDWLRELKEIIEYRLTAGYWPK